MGSLAAVAGAEGIQNYQAAAEVAQLQGLFNAPAYQPEARPGLGSVLGLGPVESLESVEFGGASPKPGPSNDVLTAPLVAAQPEAVTQASLTPAEADTSNETYAHSTRLLRAAGRLMLEQTVETPELAGLLARLRLEYESALGEMLNTDTEFRDRLEINREDEYDLIDGRLVTADGKTFVDDLIRTGAQASRERAETDPRMEIQALRDETDVSVIDAVQALEPGEGMFALSMDPKESFAIDPDYWEGLGMVGYREGLAFFQWAYRTSEGKTTLATYSVDESDLAIWREILAEHDISIPEDASTSTWHAHHAKRTDGTKADLRAEIIAMRQAFYKRRGSTTKRHSVDDYMRLNQETIDTGFDAFYGPLAMSSASKRKHPAIHELVTSLLQHPESLKNAQLFDPDVVKKLTHIRWSEHFDDDATRLIEHCILYGVVERLRTGLKDLVSGRHAVVENFVTAPSGPVAPGHAWIDTGQAARALAGNIITGTRAGRTYGGCMARMALGRAAAGSDSDGAISDRGESSPKDGSNGDGTEDAGGEDESLPPEMRCPECGVTSDTEDIVKGNELECPCCGFWADVCTGESGFRGGHKKQAENTESAPQSLEEQRQELFRKLGFTTRRLLPEVPSVN